MWAPARIPAIAATTPSAPPASRHCPAPPIPLTGETPRYSPEELLVASISACHMLWYLHLCADSGIVVTDYRDQASGVMRVNPDGSGCFAEATLRPRVSLSAESDPERAQALHVEAHRYCFIAASVNFPIRIEPEIQGKSEPGIDCALKSRDGAGI